MYFKICVYLKSMKMEDRIQQEIVQWYRNNYCLKHHSPRGMIFAVPNQKQHHLNRIGVLGGVSDLIVILPNSKMVFVEVKTPKGKVSEKQNDFANRVARHGFDYDVVRSLDDFKRLVVFELSVEENFQSTRRTSIEIN